ncbi:hypothetical protein [Vibrio diabolicus]|uniref:hypothetical protein n=1 Tax=Vibrio diabolicus TaxID=50719 RepID=UPI003B5A2C2A
MLNTAQLQRYNDFSTLLCIESTRQFSEEMDHVNYLYSSEVQKLIDKEAIQIKELHRSIHEIAYTRTHPLQTFEHNDIKLMFCVSSHAENKFQVAVFIDNPDKRVSLGSSKIDELLEGKLND